MRTLFVGALAATLVGCSCLAPPQAGVETCIGPSGSGFACLNRTAAAPASGPEPASSAPNFVRPKARPKIAAKKEEPSSPPSSEKKPLATETAKSTATPAKAEPVASGQSSKAPDPVIALAKVMVAAKLTDPASAEFGEMKRAMRTNTLGQSVDTICGRVKDKKASGEGTEDKSFLYLVKENEAYVTEGSSSSPGAIAYGSICN